MQKHYTLQSIFWIIHTNQKKTRKHRDTGARGYLALVCQSLQI